MLEIVQAIQQLDSSDLVGFGALSPVTIIGALFLLTLISEDAACLSAGMFASRGEIGLPAAIMVCFAGILIGDVALYWAGRFFGSSLVENSFASRFVSANSVKRASAWFERRGASVVFISRFVTGMRLPTYLAAGILRTSFRKFLFYFALAAVVWTPIAVGVGFGSSGVFTNGVLLGLAIGFLGLRLAAKLLSHHFRRLFVGRIKRLVNWEFWPLPVFYLPVFLYVLVLAIKHRSLTVFTSANPSISSGGLVGESKDSIYKLINSSKTAGEHVLKHKIIRNSVASDEKVRQIRDFIRENALAYPIILKPDVGERGKDVVIARNDKQLTEYISNSSTEIIVQEFFEGVEASVFYYCFPEWETGKIFSITEKSFPSLVGDGRSDLQTLILSDPRAVMLAKSYFDQNKDRLEEVPAAGEVVKLIEIGTHSRGAIFADGDWLRTENLEAAIDEICRGVPGFYFGRFDLRAKSFADFQNGGPFKIIELNGVSSESTNIYDRRFSIFDAYAILFRQWRIAFEIGAANRAKGFSPTAFSTLFKLIFTSRENRTVSINSAEIEPTASR